MKKLCICFILLTSYILNAQTVSDLFRHSDVKISWLGVDFSHVKLIGNFAEFSDAGEKSTLQIRDKYFPNWNRLILDEPTRYDLKGMLRKDNLYIDIDDVTKLNAKTHLEEMFLIILQSKSRIL